MNKEIEQCKYIDDCEAECNGLAENAELCDSFQLHQKLEQAVTRYNLVVKQNKGLQSDCNVYKTALIGIKEIASKFDYWGNNLTDASNVINDIKEQIDEVLNG